MDSQGPSAKEMILDAASQALGEGALDTLEPTTDIAKPSDSESPGTFKHTPHCLTQRPTPRAFEGGPAGLCVGLNATCPRWAPGSVITWAAWRSGFDSQEDANYAAEHLQIAAQIWNAAKIGVTFEWVPLAKDATFVVCHGGDMGPGNYAQGFFPNHNDLNYVFVYSACFTELKEHLWRVFLHELGHVLGLRHEFALVSPTERQWKAVEFGPRNELSVMNYRVEPPQLQQSDIVSTRLFYSLRNDANGNPPKIEGTPVKDYTPM
jgi:hypothetical protein